VTYRPLIKVHLWSGLRSLADGREIVEVRASTIAQMLDALVVAYPGLAEPIKAGVSVSVDGKIYSQGLTQKVAEESEIYLLQRIKGG